MAAFEDGSYGSTVGKALIAKVLAGTCKMHYTRAAAGKGTIPDGQSPKTMSDCADYVMDAKIASITNPVDGECQVTVQIFSANVETGFYCTNIVLFAEDPDLGEIPFTYLSLENDPEWVRPASSTVGKLATFDLIVAVGDVDTVTATIDPDALLTAAQVQQMISEHNTDASAHAELLAKLQNMIAASGMSITAVTLAIPSAGWKESGSTHYPYVNDVECASSSEDCYPIVTIEEDSEDTAYSCTLRKAADTLDGAVRFWAKTIPTVDITCSVALVQQGSAVASGTGGSYILPTASASTLGGVKVKDGSGLKVDANGYLAITAASNAEAEALF